MKLGIKRDREIERQREWDRERDKDKLEAQRIKLEGIN